MKTNWFIELFGNHKPIIAMCHLNALPGDPGFDRKGGMKQVIEWARRDLKALQDGAVDAIMFSNEFSLPYMTHVEPITIVAMARIIGEIHQEITVPFGVNVLWDPIASLDLAVTVEAKFVREIFSGVYASDFGLWNTNSGVTIRHQHRMGGEEIRLLFNIVPEAAAYLGERDIVSIAKSTVFNNHPDALCVSGLTAGAQADLDVIKNVKEAVPGTPVFVNTGMRLDNLEEKLAIADGAIVGTTFKYEGKFENHVDVKRVAMFMEKVRAFRNGTE